MNLLVRFYGTSGTAVAVLHGGPGAPGYVAPVARGLADAFRVIEPFQRPSGGEPLTVARHVEDLRETLAAHAARLDEGSLTVSLVEEWAARLTH